MQEIETSYHKKIHQTRSEKAINEIFEAAIDLVNTENVKLLNSRELSHRSGYSIGNIYHYFKKIDDIFAHLFQAKRSQAHSRMAKKLEEIDVNIIADEFFEIFVSEIFLEWNKIKSKILNKLVRHYLKRSKEPEKFYATADVLIEPMVEAFKKNKTGTLREIDAIEMRFLMRCLQVTIASPFLEQNPIAGTQQHKKIAINICQKLFRR